MTCLLIDLPSTDHAFGGANGFMKAVRPVMPNLRAYARRLTGNTADTDDLVQDTLIRAWRARERFQPGTNLKAWMFRIARNCFLTGRRRASRQVELDPEVMNRHLIEGPAQEDGLHFADLHQAVDALPDAQRQAFAGIAAGDRYAHVASELGISEEALKSRVSRARASIKRTLEVGMPAMTGQEPMTSETELLSGSKPSSVYAAWKRSGSRLIG